MKKLILINLLLLIAAISSNAQEIFDAVNANDLAKVKELVKKDASLVNLKDAAGNTPLHHAAIIGNTSIAEYLLAKGADINASNSRLNTPLHESINNSKEEIAKFLIEKGAGINNENAQKQTPLNRAANRSLIEIGKLLISRGAAVDVKDIYQRTPFNCVARHTGNVEFGKLLIENGTDINSKDGDNMKPLNNASWKGYTAFIDLLLDNRADFDTTRNKLRLTFNDALRCGSYRLFKYILEKDPDILSDDKSKNYAMRNAITGGSVEIADYLAGMNVPLNNVPDNYGWTPMHYAAFNGKEEMIRYLASKNIDINERTNSGKSIYNIARYFNHQQVVNVIKELGGDTSGVRFPVLSGEYLGQKIPAESQLLFAPDIVSSPLGDNGGNHGSITFTPDCKEIYWNMENKIWITGEADGKWTEPQMASFCKNDSYSYDNPFVTPDGKKIFFTSNRTGSVSERKENIWYAERNGNGWTEPKPVSTEVNAMQLHWGLSVSNSGTLYFGGGTMRDGGIFYSKPVNGAYSTPVKMGPEINNQDYNHCPYISPDESFIIFARFGRESRSFFISFKDKQGNWENPVKLNDNVEGVCPYISPDSKYFFWLSEGIYWMPAKFIEGLRPKE